jgi:uncharacterized spore protein YtfJ
MATTIDRSEQIDEAQLRRLTGDSMSFLDRIAERVASSNVSIAFGAPIQQGGVTVIPVAKAMWGMGGGAGVGHPQQKTGAQLQASEHAITKDSSYDAGGGGGGGVVITPVGYIELWNDTARFRPIVTPTGLVPLVISGGIMALLLLRALKSLLETFTREV